MVLIIAIISFGVSALVSFFSVSTKHFHFGASLVTIPTNTQCWASYSKNVIYYSLLVTPFKCNIVTLLITF